MCSLKRKTFFLIASDRKSQYFSDIDKVSFR